MTGVGEIVPFVGFVAFLLALPRGWNDLIHTNPLTWLLLVVLVGSLIGVPIWYVWMERQVVQSGGNTATGSVSGP